MTDWKVLAEVRQELMDCKDARIAELEKIHDKLLAAIREVHSQKGDDVCWMDIDWVFFIAGLPIPDRSVGDKEAMLRNCKRFIDTMCSEGKWISYEDLQQENEQLKTELLIAKSDLAEAKEHMRHLRRD